MDQLKAALAAFKPGCEQEERDLLQISRLLDWAPDLLSRENLTAHFTASAWTVNPDRTKVLMAYHNIYRSWAWLGGHADGDSDLLAVALREVQEESGAQTVRAVSDRIYSVEVLTVNGHEKRGVYVPSHLHLNVTYLIEVPDDALLRAKPDENSGVRWFTPTETLAAVSEPWMAERVYKKLIARLETFEK